MVYKDIGLKGFVGVPDIEFDEGGPVLMTGKAHGDGRGLFRETYRADQSPPLKEGRHWVQDNMSRSTLKGTVRGLHWQIRPMAQDKFVTVLRGAILDVVVDLRMGATSFGRAAAFELRDDKNDRLFVPIGFAHGFCTLEADTIVSYKCSAYYDPNSERALLWHDRSLAIAWPVALSEAIVSDKDRVAPLFCDLAQQDLFDL